MSPVERNAAAAADEIAMASFLSLCCGEDLSQ